MSFDWDMCAMARSSSDAKLPLPGVKRLPKLQSIGRHTKSAVVQTLTELQNSGALETSDTERSLRRQIQISTEAHSKSEAPYGPVVQQVRINTDRLEYWEFCHPFALMDHITQISTAFATCMATCTHHGMGKENCL